MSISDVKLGHFGYTGRLIGISVEIDTVLSKLPSSWVEDFRSKLDGVWSEDDFNALILDRLLNIGINNIQPPQCARTDLCA